MDHPDFDKLASEAVKSLEEKNAYLARKYNFEGTATWTFDPEPATLTFLDPDGRASNVFDVVEIGTFSLDHGTWKWGWANDSVPPEMRARAVPLKKLHLVTGNEVFIQENPVVVPLALPWKLTALSVRHLSALGSFRGLIRNGRLQLYLAMTGVRFAARARLLWP